MAYVTLLWEGHPPQRRTDPPWSVPAGDCVGRLGLRRGHFTGRRPPEIPSVNPRLDPYRAPGGVAVNLKGDEAPSGWSAGWYLILRTDLPLDRARTILVEYPETDWEP